MHNIDVSVFSLTNNSPQIDGKSLNATFELQGCAELKCEVLHTINSQEDCKFKINKNIKTLV